MIRPADVFKALQHSTEEDLDKSGQTVYISGLVDLKAMASYLNGDPEEEEPENDDRDDYEPYAPEDDD